MYVFSRKTQGSMCAHIILLSQLTDCEPIMKKYIKRGTSLFYDK